MSSGSSAPSVFDRALARQRLRRALRQGFEPFLLERLAGDLEDRVRHVLRHFPLTVDIGTPLPWPVGRLVGAGITNEVVRLSPVHEPGTVLGDEEMLPFAGGRFDLAVSLLALQGVNDLPGALLQIRRGLKPDGLFIAATLGGGTLAELRSAFAQAETELEGGVSPRVAPFADVRDMGALLQRAGFALPVTDADVLKVRYANPFALFRDLRAMGLTNNLTDRRRQPLRRTTLMRMAESYAEQFADPDGRIPATFEVIWMLGWNPHESQQKPLKPGSATVRLEDALKPRGNS
jgi:SAM-dependent methyltransferase